MSEKTSAAGKQIGLSFSFAKVFAAPSSERPETSSRSDGPARHLTTPDTSANGQQNLGNDNEKYAEKPTAVEKTMVRFDHGYEAPETQDTEENVQFEESGTSNDLELANESSDGFGSDGGTASPDTMHSVDAQPDVEAFRNVCADGAFDGHGVGSVPGSAFTPVDPTNAAAVQPALWALPSPVVCGNEDVVQAAGHALVGRLEKLCEEDEKKFLRAQHDVNAILFRYEMEHFS